MPTISPRDQTDRCFFCAATIDPINLAPCPACGRYTPQRWLVRNRTDLPAGMWERYQELLKADQAFAAAHFAPAGPVPPEDEGEAYGGGYFGGGVGGTW